MITMRDLLFLLAGLGLGSTGALFLFFLPRRTRSEKPRTAQSTARTEPPLLSRSSSRPREPVEEEDSIEVRISRDEGVVVKGRRWGIIAVCALLLLGLLYFVVRFWPTGGVPPVTPVPAATVLPPVIVLINNMDHGIEARRYNVEQCFNNQVVDGLLGRYYFIDLKDADSRESLLFGPKKYTKVEFDADFRAAMSAFHADILRRIGSEKLPYRLFVRGSADITGNTVPFLAELESGKEKSIMYLPQAPGNSNLYLSEPVSQTIPRKYANIHLPNLRAAYVQEKLQALGFDATILEGSVTNTASEKDRHATMLLYVNWPTKVAGTETL